jgi:RNA polymerase sigma factor (TIGR02999 family)
MGYASETNGAEPGRILQWPVAVIGQLVKSDEYAEITRLLKCWAAGDRDALEALTPKVYAELHQMARRYMRQQPVGHTLQSTALVNELFLRLVDARTVDWRDRAHFFAVSATAMRRILVDSARARRAAKRGGRLQHAEHSAPFDFDEVPDLHSQRDAELVALHDALNALEVLDARKARVIELRFFGGLSVEETAGVLKISQQTVMRDWKLAKAWLLRELSKYPRS